MRMAEETDTMLQPTQGGGREGGGNASQKIIELAQFFLGSAGEELEIAHGEIFAIGNPCRPGLLCQGSRGGLWRLKRSRPTRKHRAGAGVHLVP